MPTTTTAVPADGELLAAFLSGDADAREAFPRRFEPILQQLAREQALELRRHSLYEADDVAQETFVLLLSKGPDDFDPARGSAVTFTRLHLQNAVKSVRAKMRAPGVKSRSLPGPVPVSLDQRVNGNGDDGEEVCVADVVPGPDRIEDSYAAKEAVDLLLTSADGPVAVALRLLTEGEVETLTAAAERVGMSRFMLRRRLDRLAADLALALAA